MKQVAAAFVKAKRAFAPALKTSVNPHFKSKYADLAACVEAVDDAFLENGIAMYQEIFPDTEGVTVETVLLHESGESIRCGKLHVPAIKQDAQAYGSALSYARRYSLMAACGIAPEDDDGNAATRAPHGYSKNGLPKADTAPHKPTDGAMELLDDEVRKYVMHLAATVPLVLQTEGIEVLCDRLIREELEPEANVALWSLLDSKTRAAIKKEMDRRKSAPKVPA